MLFSTIMSLVPIIGTSCAVLYVHTRFDPRSFNASEARQRFGLLIMSWIVCGGAVLGAISVLGQVTGSGS